MKRSLLYFSGLGLMMIGCRSGSVNSSNGSLLDSNRANGNTDFPAPIISSVGDVTLLRGAKFVVSGENFFDGVSVKLGELDAAVARLSNEQLEVSLPNNVAVGCNQSFPCSVGITVKNSDGDLTVGTLRILRQKQNFQQVYLANLFDAATEIANLGDIDGDGSHEIAVRHNMGLVNLMSPWKNQQQSNSPPIWSVSLPSECQFTSASTESTMNIGDLDGDGFADLAVGDPTDSAGLGHGHVCILSGKTGGLLKNITGQRDYLNEHGYFGSAILALGDIDGGGKPDFLISAVGLNFSVTVGQNGENRKIGAIYFYDGESVMQSANPLPRFRITIPEAERVNYDYACFGTAMAKIDGTIAISAPYYTRVEAGGVGTNRGIIHTYRFESSSSSFERITSLEGALSNVSERFTLLGLALFDAGDLNGDGFNDLLVHSDRNSMTLVAKSGKATDNWANLFPLIAGSTPTLGISIATQLDVNGDGDLDFVTGEPNFNDGPNQDRGRIEAYAKTGITLGSALTGAADNQRLGTRVINAGDLNGDGFDEVCTLSEGGSTVTSSVTCLSL